MAQRDQGKLATVEGVYAEYERYTKIANDKHKPAHERQHANEQLDKLQPRVMEAIELSNTEYLRLKFDRMVRVTAGILPAIGIALFIFLIFTHSNDQTEQQLVHPVPIQIAWNAGVGAVLKKAGVDESCYTPTRPQFLQVSEKSGLRAGVLVIPKDPGPTCPVVRVVVTDTKEVYPDN